MTDHGPHSHQCADADGAACHCDCHGTKHGILHVRGGGHEHGASVAITPVKGHSGKTTHYLVTDKKTGLAPGGGTPEERLAKHSAGVNVTGATARPKTLPGPAAHRIEQIRAGLPKTREEWAALVPRIDSERDKLLKQADEHEARAQVIRTKAKAALDAIHADPVLRAKGDAAIADEIKYNDDIRRGQYAAGFDEDAARLRAEAETASTVKRNAVYRLDPATGYRMPTDAQNEHLDRVLDAGHQALAAVHEHFDRDPQLAALRADLARSAAHGERIREIQADSSIVSKSAAIIAASKDLPEMTDSQINRAIRVREAAIIHEVLASARGMGGISHDDASPAADDMAAQAVTFGAVPGVSGARKDWRERLDAAENYYPADWLRLSAAEPMTVVGADRAFYSDLMQVMALPNVDRDDEPYNGAFPMASDEVTVHELGHRMESAVPGLRDLEFAYVRRRSTGADGKLEDSRKLGDIYAGHGYAEKEIAFEDKWTIAYAGKTYEAGGGDPALHSWEVFQVGTQDLFGRGTGKFDASDELQAFTLGVLLTLG